MQADLLLSMCYKPTKKIIVVTIVEVKIRKSETLHDSTSKGFMSYIGRARADTFLGGLQ